MTTPTILIAKLERPSDGDWLVRYTRTDTSLTTSFMADLSVAGADELDALRNATALLRAEFGTRAVIKVGLFLAFELLNSD
jgi:hypothetical protein